MNIAVYCSSREDLPQEAFDCARATGEWIGRKRGTLVYGGVNAGLMHVTAQAARAGGGHSYRGGSSHRSHSSSRLY